MKFAVTLSLGVTAYLAARAAVRPGARRCAARSRSWRCPRSSSRWPSLPNSSCCRRTMDGSAYRHQQPRCLGLIPAIGLAPLAILIGVKRTGAPTHPTLAGAMAGLLAGGIAATFYAAHCFDDSPLFVAIWYTLAVAVLAASRRWRGDASSCAGRRYRKGGGPPGPPPFSSRKNRLRGGLLLDPVAIVAQARIDAVGVLVAAGGRSVERTLTPGHDAVPVVGHCRRS